MERDSLVVMIPRIAHTAVIVTGLSPGEILGGTSSRCRDSRGDRLQGTRDHHATTCFGCIGID